MRAFGYFISILSVIMLGLVAWPRPGDPSWHVPVLLAGMLTSIFGMGLRWKDSSRRDAELREVEEQQAAANGAAAGRAVRS